MAVIGVLGVIGGSGALGGAIARRLLETRALTPERLWISNRDGRRNGFEKWAGVQITTDNQALADACDTVLYALPPKAAAATPIAASGKLVLSIMAGVTIASLSEISGGARIIRAMSSPTAVDLGRAYSPWMAGPTATDADRATANAIFGACGLTDELFDEAHLDLFTALTGPVPGFVAAMAQSCAAYAEARGAPPEIALRAVRQLFLASGLAMSAPDAPTPAEAVRDMIDYAGTTAAGLLALRAAPFDEALAAGLDAAAEKAARIAEE